MFNKLTLKDLNELIAFLENQDNWIVGGWYRLINGIPCYCAHGHICYNPESPFKVSSIIGYEVPSEHITNSIVEEFAERFNYSFGFSSVNDNTYEAYNKESAEVSPKWRILTLLYILQYEMEEEAVQGLRNIVNG